MLSRPGLSVVYMDPTVSNESFDRYLQALAKDFAAVSRSKTRRGVLYDVPRPGVITASRRAQVAKVLNEFRDPLADVTAAYAMVTPSRVVRGILAAIFWIAPPPYAHRIVKTVRLGFDFIEERMPETDAEFLSREYQAVKTELLGRMAALSGGPLGTGGGQAS